MAEYPKLTVLFEELRGKTFEVNKETMSIGRRDSNDICIPEGSLSGHHADIIRKEKDGKVTYILRDNDSTNGTRINNVPLTGEAELKNSDLILFGGVEVLFDGSDTPAGKEHYTKSHTIDISELYSTLTSAPAMTNLSPFAGTDDDKKGIMTQKVTVAVIIFISLLLVAFVGFIVFKALTLKENPQSNNMLPHHTVSAHLKV